METGSPKVSPTPPLPRPLKTHNAEASGTPDVKERIRKNRRQKKGRRERGGEREREATEEKKEKKIYLTRLTWASSFIRLGNHLPLVTSVIITLIYMDFT